MAASDLAIRVADRADAALVAGFVHGLLSELAPDADLSLAEIGRTTDALIGEEDLTGLLAFRGEHPVGLLMVNVCMAIYAGGRFGEITELYVDPAERSGGVASALVEAACAMARARGWRRLEVGAPDQPAWRRTLAFYLREGFVEVGPRLKKIV